MMSGLRGLVPAHHIPPQQTSEPAQQEIPAEARPADPRDQPPLHPSLRPQPGRPPLRDPPLPPTYTTGQSVSPLLGSHICGEAPTLSQP